MTEIFRGGALADRILDAARDRLERAGATASLVVMRPADPAADAYVGRLAGLAPRAGIRLEVVAYPSSGSEARAVLVEKAGRDGADAALLLGPYPSGIDAWALVAALGPARDAEGRHPEHLGRLALGRPRIVPATAGAVHRIARHLVGPLAGRRVAVVGASPLVGRALSLLLVEDGATVRIAQRATRDLPAETRGAEVVVAAAGVPHLIGRDHLSDGAVVIDVGVSMRAGRLVGDVDRAAVGGLAAVLTHVPDGVGPVTAAGLLENVATLACARRTGRSEPDSSHSIGPAPD